MIEKLCRVQSALKAPKNQRNEFGKYNYRSCEDILEAVKPLLSKEGLLLTITDEIVMVGNRYYVKATATVTDGNSSVSTTAYAREAENRKGQDDSQVTGSSSSYARKYALNGLFCIDDTKDADTMDNTDKPKKAKEKTNIADALKKIAERAKKQGLSTDDMREIMKRQYSKETSKELTESEIADLAAHFIDYAKELIADEAALMGEIENE